MKDKYDNISWWIYDTNYGEYCTKIYSAEDHNTVLEDLKTAGDLYDYLVKIEGEE